MKQFNNVPRHVAIIMDGNRRWAKAHGLPALEGHRQVVDKILEPLVERAADLGVKYLTFWAWSTENWNRDRQEVSGVMNLFRHAMRKRLERLHKQGVRILVIGDLSKFPEDIQEVLNQAIAKTSPNKRISTVFALNYGGRDEILRAINKVICDKRYLPCRPAGAIRKSEKRFTSHVSRLTEQEFGKYLDTKDIPDPDFIIRTSGEQRLSGFLPWQSVYSEFYFPTWFMPDFTPDKLDEAVAEFGRRKRRFGK